VAGAEEALEVEAEGEGKGGEKTSGTDDTPAAVDGKRSNAELVVVGLEAEEIE